jgi:signal peptidase II
MPVKGRKSQGLISGLFVLAILGIDQVSKFLVRLKLTQGQSIPIMKNILHITFIKNTGAAFGMFRNSTLVFIAISIMAVLVLLGFIINVIKKGQFLFNPMANSGLILIVSGAMGNLLDRLNFGYVIDFIDVRIWPVFNIADSCITIGTILLLIHFLISQKIQAQLKA